MSMDVFRCRSDVYRSRTRFQLRGLRVLVDEPMCATKRIVVSPAQQEGTRREAAIREAIVRSDAEEAAAVDVAVELRRRHQAAAREAVRAQTAGP
jgi:hypothetical protein